MRRRPGGRPLPGRCDFCSASIERGSVYCDACDEGLYGPSRRWCAARGLSAPVSVSGGVLRHSAVRRSLRGRLRAVWGV